MTESDLSYLQIYLGPLLSHLERSDVTDIYINRPGEIWVEALGGMTERHLAPEITEALLMRLSRQIASMTHQGISRENPLLAAALPNGARVQIVAPPATRGPMAIAIRKHVSSDLCLADYDDQGAFGATRSDDAPDPADTELDRLHSAGEWSAFLRLAVRSRKTIVVSGGTSTGKTTFVNALLREVPETERLVIIEDTPELALRHENAVGLLAVRGAMGEANVTADDLLVASLRMRPDRIILGEIRGAEAFTFLRAVNTGHPGSLTTIHADTPDRAIQQLTLQCLQYFQHLSRSDIIAYLNSVVDVVVQLDRRAGKRVVAGIRWTPRNRGDIHP